MSPSIRFHPSSRPTVETPLPSSPLWPCSSLSLLIFLKRRLSLSSTPFLSLPLCFPSFSSPTFSLRVLADSDLANPRDGGGERRGWRGIENGRFHTRGGEGRTKETEHEGNGETKRLKGNRTSKRSTKRKKARKGERSLCVCVCVWEGELDNTVIASKTGPETINRDSSLEQPLFLFVELCSFFLTKTQTTRIVTVTVSLQVNARTLNFSKDRMIGIRVQ